MSTVILRHGTEGQMTWKDLEETLSPEGNPDLTIDVKWKTGRYTMAFEFPGSPRNGTYFRISLRELLDLGTKYGVRGTDTRFEFRICSIGYGVRRFKGEQGLVSIDIVD